MDFPGKRDWRVNPAQAEFNMKHYHQGRHRAKIGFYKDRVVMQPSLVATDQKATGMSNLFSGKGPKR